MELNWNKMISNVAIAKESLECLKDVHDRLSRDRDWYMHRETTTEFNFDGEEVQGEVETSDPTIEVDGEYKYARWLMYTNLMDMVETFADNIYQANGLL